MKTDERYLQFPLSLLRDLFTDKKKVIDQIIRYGIYRYSKSFSYTLNDVSRQLMYAYYRNDLSSDLLKAMTTYVNDELIELDEDYNGFGDTKFSPDIEVEQLLGIFESDKEFEGKAIEYYQMHLSYQSLGLTGSIEQALKVAKEIEKHIPANDPMPMISRTHLFNFRDHDKTEFELAQFTVFIALRSIIGGKRQYAKTNKLHIASRMFGYASHKHLPDKFSPAIKELFNKYTNRYHIDKVLQELELNWNVKIYSKNMRGMLVAMGNKIKMEDLILAAETQKRKNRIEALIKSKDEARVKALQQLNKGEQLK